MKIKNVELYQAKNGSIQLLLGNKNFTLLKEQIDIIGDSILWDIENFDLIDYKKYYNN